MESDLGRDDETRAFCGTNVIEWNDKSLPSILTSLIKKMLLTRQKNNPTVLRLSNGKTSDWKTFIPGKTADTALMEEHSWFMVVQGGLLAH